MDSNNTWKSLGTVLWIASTYICFIEDTFFQTKNIKFCLFFQKFPLLGLGLGLGLVSKLNTALQEET